MHRRIGIIVICLVTAAGLFSLPSIAQENKVDLSDDFETAPLDVKRWSLYRVPQKRYWIDRHTVFDGKGALAIRVKGSDIRQECQCQQSELREAAKRRLNFGDDAWYAFTFRLRGNWPPTGGQRWVIGGWKQETDGSAFIAQRFDKGVYHITLESGSTRVLLASASEDAGGFLETLRKGLLKRFEFVSDKSRYTGNADLKIEYGTNPVLPDPAADWVSMVYHIRGGLKNTGLVEVFANGKFIARAIGTIGIHEMAGPTQYFKIGHNRDLMPGTATLFLDNFRRARSKNELNLPVHDKVE